MTSKPFLSVSFVLLFAFVGNFAASAQKRQLKLSVQDKREIIKSVLQDSDFSEALEYSSDGTVYLSTENIPPRIQTNFPKIKGVNFHFITPAEISKLKLPLRIFYFGEFKIKSSTAAVYFGRFYSGSGSALEYIFRKSNGSWRFKTGKMRLFRS